MEFEVLKTTCNKLKRCFQVCCSVLLAQVYAELAWFTGLFFFPSKFFVESCMSEKCVRQLGYKSAKQIPWWSTCLLFWCTQCSPNEIKLHAALKGEVSMRAQVASVPSCASTSRRCSKGNWRTRFSTVALCDNKARAPWAPKAPLLVWTAWCHGQLPAWALGASASERGCCQLLLIEKKKKLLQK